MILIEVSNKSYFVRHWFIWYHVTRGGTAWKRLQVKPRHVRKAKQPMTNSIQVKAGGKSIEEIARSLKAAGK